MHPIEGSLKLRPSRGRLRPGQFAPAVIAVHCDDDRDAYAGEIVATALVRSFSPAQVARVGSQEAHGVGNCEVWINPGEDAAAAIERLLGTGGKALVLGRIGARVADALGLCHVEGRNIRAAWADCPLDPARHHDESPASIHYDRSHPLGRLSPIPRRPLCRFDFANEWNNLGFGRVATDGGPWSLQSVVECGSAAAIARIVAPQCDGPVYASLNESAGGAALWFNRPVGPVDSLEWRVVESFFGDYRGEDLPCRPYLSELPAGYSAAVCARLDCDEAVSSARPLVELYRDCGLPLSLALLTGQPMDADDLALLRQTIAWGGSVVSHSVRHEPNWGGTYERALAEAGQSRAWIEEHLPEAAPLAVAVSPFHQNPAYAVQALADCGYQGFVGGIIANDPEYLLGRAGRAPLVTPPIVSLSTQCMLHGDCYARYGNSIDAYRQSFDTHRAGGSIFGYLDHPFSARYQYGWSDEATRIEAHRALIEHIGTGGVWWANLHDVMAFLRRRDATLVGIDAGGKLSVEGPPAADQPRLVLCWKGQHVAI